MQVPYTQHTLANGLNVILHEDHDCPIVGVSVWYHVGSKDERPGRTGLAHLFEHLMFEGSEHHDDGYFRPLEEAGAAVNGSTNSDRTNYWEVVPTGALELALWMESDRMGFLLPALSRKKFDNQRDVVLNERRQNYENRPYGLATMALLDGLYPPDHPYRWPTIGSADDLRATRLDEAHEFFRTHYGPENASLALAGDIDPELALELVDGCFGPIASRGPARRPRAVRPLPTLGRDDRRVLEDRVELPRLYLAWHTPALYSPDDAALDLFADLLGNGKSSRLYRTLVYDRRIAAELGAVQVSRELSSYFQVVATAAPGHTLHELDQAFTEEIARAAAHGVPETELVRAKARAEAQFVYRLQTVGGFRGKCDQLNAYWTFVGDPGFFQRDLDRYRGVTSDHLRETVAAYLPADRRLALCVVPAGRTDLALPGSAPVFVS